MHKFDDDAFCKKNWKYAPKYAPIPKCSSCEKKNKPKTHSIDLLNILSRLVCLRVCLIQIDYPN